MWERFIKSSLAIVIFLFINLELFAEEKIKIVTTFTIIADITKNITGDAAEVLSITKPGAEIHGYQPTPKDIVKAYDADLILWNGMNLEIWFEQFFSNLNETTSITVSEGIDAINISEGDYQGLPNPHAWMGLNEALIYVDNIVNALSYYDKKNSELYFQNAAKYKEKIISTIEPLKEAIASSTMLLLTISKWLVGSSNSNRLDGSNNILPSASLAFSPPESTFTFFSISSPENKNPPRYVLICVSFIPKATFSIDSYTVSLSSSVSN